MDAFIAHIDQFVTVTLHRAITITARAEQWLRADMTRWRSVRGLYRNDLRRWTRDSIAAVRTAREYEAWAREHHAYLLAEYRRFDAPVGESVDVDERIAA